MRARLAVACALVSLASGSSAVADPAPGSGAAPAEHLEEAAGGNEPGDSEEEAWDESSDDYQEEAAEGEQAAPPVPIFSVSLEQARQTVDRVATEQALPFCKNTSFRLSRDDRRLCPLATELKSRCPALAGSCSGAAPPPLAPPPRSSSAPEVRGGGAGASALQLVFWLLVALVVGGVGVALIRSLRGEEPDAGDEDEEDEPALERPQPVAPVAPPLTDAQRLLAEARARASAGDYVGAVEHAYHAALRRLDRLGSVHVRQSATNGDYLRSLRDDPELHTALKLIVDRVERAQFGGRVPDAAHVQQVLQQAERVVSRALGVLLLVASALGLGSCASHGGDTTGMSPSGLELLELVLERHGSQVSRRFNPVHAIEDDVAAVLVTDAELSAGEWERLATWARAGGTLVLAGRSLPTFARFGGRSQVDLGCTSLSLAEPYTGPDRFGAARVVGAGGSSVDTYRSGDEFIECGKNPFAILYTLGEGEVAVFPDQDFFSNASLLAADNAFVVLGLLRTPGRVEIIGPWTGAGSDNPVAAMHASGLGPLIIEVVLILLLFALRRGLPFSARREPPQRSRRSFVEHVRALGDLYRRAQASRHALGAYAGWALERLRERNVRARDGKLSSLAAEVARRSGHSEALVMAVLVEAVSARDELDRDANSPGDLQIFRQLSQMLNPPGGKS